MTRSGAGTFAAIELEYRRVCQEKPARRERNAVEQVIELAATNTAANSALLNENYNLFQLVNELIGAVTLAISLLPFGRILRGVQLVVRRLVPRAGAQNLIAQQLDDIIVQQAANDRLFVQLRQAANDARFLRTGTR